jgi:hypothetical protein
VVRTCSVASTAMAIPPIVIVAIVGEIETSDGTDE